MNIKEYFEEIEKQVKENYELAREAKKKGYDPVADVEVPLANSLAERVVGLISVLYPQIFDRRIIDRILALEKEYGNLDPAVALVIAEEVAKEKYCKFEDHVQAMEAGIRVAIGYMTLGYVSSPIEGFIQLKIKKTRNNEDYISPYYSGPIRSAGGTEAAFSLVVVDYLREVFGYAFYDPTEEEVKRGIQECYEYHERINNLQYLPSEKEIEFIMKNLSIQLTGDASEDKEVYNFKDLPRIETNFIRSGFSLVLGEGLAQKAPKILKRVLKLQERGFKLSGWNWLKEFCDLQKQIKNEKKGSGSRAGATYMQDLVAGRPVFAHPSESGAFRLRYGRSRNTGYSTLAVHPATMGITNGFIAIGTQLKIEKPTKGCTVASCDSIAGPIVKLKNGEVRRVKTYTEAKEIYSNVQEIIYLGDLLVPYGDFLNRNHLLEKQGYIEQYWDQELKEKGENYGLKVSFDEAIKISEKHKQALHPDYIFFWREISYELFLSLIDWIAHAEMKEKVFDLPYSPRERERFAKGKRALEIIGCEHKVGIENVIISLEEVKHLLFNLGIDIRNDKFEGKMEEIVRKVKEIGEKKTLEVINLLSKYEIRDKSGTFIGARMGRPEKAKLRKLTGSPHVLFPVGDEAGRLRSVQSAYDVGSVKAEFPVYWCDKCKLEGVYASCDVCKERCVRRYYCPDCNSIFQNKCEEHGKGFEFREKRIDMRSYLEYARRKVGVTFDDLKTIVKGVRGTMNRGHDCEHLAKGLLRAKYNLNVNKDGTIRYDMTEQPLTHFKAKEIGTSVERLKELGYEKDIAGKELENEEQILEIFPHDIILPASPESPDERADTVFMNVGKFIDDELTGLYDLHKVFNAQKKEDMVGSMFGCMAPHTSSTVVGRLIGFSKIQSMLASPYIHAAMRRDTDGDEAAVMLLMDLLLNFSKRFLPSHRGGTQDAPLVLNMRLRANEVDDMIFDVDVSEFIPLELYKAAEEHKSPGEIKMKQVKGRLGGDKEFTDFFYSYDTSDINLGPLCSSYKTLPTMDEKVTEMMILCKKIRAVDTSDVARLIIERHFIRDTRGNLRKFSQQGFRCVKCNDKYRRVPLAGKCLKCGGKILFTISEGSILKYMQPALDLAKEFNVQPYLLESLELTEMYIQSIFGKEKEKQAKLF